LNYRSSLSRARGWGSAKHGSHHWALQRFSAVALIPLSLWFVFSVGNLQDISYAGLTEWLANPWVPVLLCLFFACAYYHAALGLQVVIEDYVASEFARNALLIIIKLLLLLMAVSTLVSVLLTAL
jgi:succinate dehydrogenase / fumarate reductase, membrane anchor subunit